MIRTIEAVQCEYCKTLLEKSMAKYIVAEGEIWVVSNTLAGTKTLIEKDSMLVFCSPDHLRCFLANLL